MNPIAFSPPLCSPTRIAIISAGKVNCMVAPRIAEINKFKFGECGVAG